MSLNFTIHSIGTALNQYKYQTKVQEFYANFQIQTSSLSQSSISEVKL